MIKVIISGFKGRMGSTAVDMVNNDPELELAALIDPYTTEKEVDGIPVFNDKADVLGVAADVWVDFTIPDVAYANTKFAIEHNICPVVGTTGFTEAQISELIDLSQSKKIGGLIAPNFAIGAILVMEFAKKQLNISQMLKLLSYTMIRKKMRHQEQQLRRQN